MTSLWLKLSSSSPVKPENTEDGSEASLLYDIWSTFSEDNPENTSDGSSVSLLPYS